MPAKPTWHPWIPSSHFAPGGLADGLVGAWFALEGAGGTLHDLSRRGNHGSLQAGVGWVAGRDGPVLDFPGNTGDTVTVPDSASLSSAETEGTYFYKATFREHIADESFEGILDTAPNSIGAIQSYGRNDGTVLRAAIGGSGSWLIEYALPAGGWNGETHTVAMTWLRTGGNTDLEMFVDGVSVGTLTISRAPKVSGMDIGTLNEDNNTALEMPHLLFYARALPASDIRKLHHDPYALLRPVRRWWAVALDVEAAGITHPVIGSGIVNSQAIIGGAP